MKKKETYRPTRDQACGVTSRSQIPNDHYGYNTGIKWESGKIRMGGFLSVIPFNDKGLNDAGTARGAGKKVY